MRTRHGESARQSPIPPRAEQVEAEARLLWPSAPGGARLLQNGESIVYVKDQLGHHSIKVTVDVYGHLVPGANKAAVDRLD